MAAGGGGGGGVGFLGGGRGGARVGLFPGIVGRGLDPAVRFWLPIRFRATGMFQTLPSAFGRHLP